MNEDGTYSWPGNQPKKPKKFSDFTGKVKSTGKKVVLILLALVVLGLAGTCFYTVNDKQQALERPFDHRVIIRPTELTLPPEQQEKTTIHTIYDLLIHDDARNRMIVEDVRTALSHGRNPVVITERKEHLFWLENAFADVKPLFVMRGGMRRKELTSILQAFSAVPEGTPRLLLATGKFLGEGFDDPRLDTLFLTMPISWKGTLAQYAGRLHRLYDRKTEVIIYDYADLKITMTMRMFERRVAGYRAIGYRITDDNAQYLFPE